MKILLPTSLELSPTIPAGVTAVAYDPHVAIPAEHLDADALVVWDNDMGQLREDAPRMPNLKWVQSLMAGPNAILPIFDEEVLITSGRGLHDKTVAEHATALVLALLRRLPEAAVAQREHRWDTGIGEAQPLHPADRVTTLIDARVLIWGFGSIGSTLAPLLAAFGAHVRGVARTAGVREGFEVVAQDGLLDALGETDVLVMILPADASTANALGREQIDALPDRALLVNVGRGQTVDQDELSSALREHRLGGAAIDVTAPEPLPADSSLWDVPGLIITPHAAGGRPVGADELVSANLAAFVAGEQLRNAVAR